MHSTSKRTRPRTHRDLSHSTSTTPSRPTVSLGTGGRADAFKFASLTRTARLSAGFAALLVAVAIGWPLPAAAQLHRAPTEGIPVPDRSVTTQSDAVSIEANPAGLGFLESTEMRYGFDIDADPSGDGINHQHALFAGAGASWIGGGFGIQWLDRPSAAFSTAPYQKYTAAGALRPFDGWSLGLGLNFFGSGHDRRLNRLTSLDLGTQLRPTRFLGFGIALRDANRPFVQPTRALPLRIESGAAVRLFDGAIVLDGQFEWMPRENALLAAPRVALEPFDGVRAFSRAALPLDSNFRDRRGAATRLTAGLAFSLGHVGLESASSFHTSGASGTDPYAGQAQHLWYSPRPRPSPVRPAGRWVQVDLEGGIAERASDTPFRADKESFLELLLDLRGMASDPSVEGVLFKIGNSGLGYGQAWELRQQIEHLRDSETTTASYLTNPSFLETYVASAADRVYLLPTEPYEPEGIRVTRQFYAEALSKAGVQAEFVRVGDYKSAPEAYTRQSPSEPALEQTETFVDTIYGDLVGEIADDRDLEKNEVSEAIDQIPLYPTEAVERDFADTVVYPDELRPHLREEYGTTRLIESGYDPSPSPTHGWEGRPEIAVVYVDGSIVRGESTETPLLGRNLTGSETIASTLEELGRDSNVEAIVVRVDSPGGSAVASDLIYRAIRRVAQYKPVIASMGDIAASGGYYAAAGADEIFATPHTLTGSIGIFAGKFSVHRLASWLGIRQTAIERGRRIGRYDLFTPWSDEERESVVESMNYLYHLFVEQAAATRPLSPEELDERARGRVWSGIDAEEQRLVDRLGGLVDAIRAAEKRADLPPGSAKYRSYPTPSPLFDVPFGVGGVASHLSEQLQKSEQNDRTRADTVFQSLLARIERAIRLPLIYDQQEPLMLPYPAIVVER